MFAHIAAGYEGFDHLASLGQDYLWRPRALWALERFRHRAVERALDVGCGTGELARAVARQFPRARVVATDFTRPMLERTRGRAGPGGPGARFAYGQANALALPFRPGAFDLVTNAFVARNLSDLGAALREMRRVLAPGGVLLTLEITEPASATLGRLFHAYFDRVVPALGRAVGSEGPYRYLPESLRTLPPRAGMLAALGRAGFGRLRAVPLSGGIVTAFLAETDDGPQSR